MSSNLTSSATVLIFVSEQNRPRQFYRLIVTQKQRKHPVGLAGCFFLYVVYYLGMAAQKPTIKKEFDTLPGALFLTNTKGEIVYANNAMEARTGFSVSEIVGRRPKDLWGGNMERPFYAWMWETIRDEKCPFVSTVINRRKDQSSHREYIHIAPVLSDSGNAAYFLEMHPRIEDDARESRFQEEFQNVFSRQSRDLSETLAWMLPWLGGSIRHDDETNTLEHFFTQTLVAPTDVRYAARREDGAMVLAAQESPSEFRLLYQKYKDDVRAYFRYRLGRDCESAEELSQETFLRAFRYLPSFRSLNASYGTYLLRIAHNLLANHFREKSSVALDDVPEASLRVDAEYDAYFDRQSVRRAVEHLSPIERQMVAMKYEEGLSMRDIATVLQKSENAVKLHLSRARKKLRDML